MNTAAANGQRFATSVCIALACLIAPDVTPAADRVTRFLSHPTEWFQSQEAARIGTNVLRWQIEPGGWPKNLDTSAPRDSGSKTADELKPTFDNGATTGELRFLARLTAATGSAAFRAAFVRGFEYVLTAQYENGGWPQSYPPGLSYARHITFNDDTMVRLMLFLREAATSDTYAFLEPRQQERARRAFDRGIQCILKCQVRENGKLTAWCAQHDEKDFSPRPARSYELASLSGAESVGIVRLLMSLDKPSPEVVHSVRAAVQWFEAAKLKGIRVVKVPDPKAPNGMDKRVMEDPVASPMWARFYDLQTGRPIFCDRDGVPKAQLGDIGYERRNGYDWLDYWPRALLEREYPAWARRMTNDQ
jgi:PelA/Pel-15E family pectate lyase